MDKFYLYAKTASIQVLRDVYRKKVILVGGDFGYPNFGDVLQLKGTINFYQNRTELVPVPVYTIESIPSIDAVQKMQDRLGVDALIFVSERNLDTKTLDLELIDIIHGVQVIHLYGGGFLNKFWGNFVLDVVEHFLKAAPNVAYVASGHQIGPEIKERLLSHLDQFNPQLFGVRDFDSLELLKSWNKKVVYSFDDAYEEILNLAQQFKLTDVSRIIGHINLSDYTSENIDDRCDVLLNTFRELKRNFPENKLTVVNAYSDKRVNVIDSIASLVQLEMEFPYSNYSVVDLVSAAYTGKITEPELLDGKLAISCSYHVTMLLQVAGVPCWLVAANSFYDQKSRSLNVVDDYEDFVVNPKVPDYSSRVALRNDWLSQLFLKIENRKGDGFDMVFETPPHSEEKYPIRFKSSGVDDLKKGIAYLENQIQNKNHYIEKMLSDKAFFIQQINDKEKYILELKAGKSWLEVELAKKNSYIKELLEAKSWLDEQLNGKQV